MEEEDEKEKLAAGENSNDQMLLIQQIHKPMFYSTSSMIELLQKITPVKSGLDSKIRFP